MSKLNDQIARAEADLAAAQDRLEFLEDKKRRYNRKRARKQHRKLMRNPIYASNWMLSKRIAKNFFEPSETTLGNNEFNGISRQIEMPRYKT